MPYAFDDNTDPKSKWVRKIIAWLCCPGSLFCEEFDGSFSQFKDDVCKVKVSHLKSRNQNNQNFYQVQKVLLLINLPQKIQEAVTNVEITLTK